MLGGEGFQELVELTVSHRHLVSCVGVCRAYHLQFILPKLLFFRLIQEREIADMMYEDVAKKRKLRIRGRDFSSVTAKGRAEPL